ncbi:MAG: DUF4256 domain-containing protein [Verrucomicrobiales bacterium]|nr:DUF4256 domain-containing protein [Verrucomicrobiales bacterium]
MNHALHRAVAGRSRDLFRALNVGFEANPNRHPHLDWTRAQSRLEARPEKRWALHTVEPTADSPPPTPSCSAFRGTVASRPCSTTASRSRTITT